MRIIRFLNVSVLFLITCSALGQTGLSLSGKVVDINGKPVLFASLMIKETQTSTFSNEKGEFLFSIPGKINRFTLSVSYVGKKTFEHEYTSSQLTQPLRITLLDNSLALEEVDVAFSIKNTENSSSSIVFDKEAIEQARAFSLMDVLNLLPGKQTSTPNILGPQTITLRGDQGGLFDMNNSLGVAIVMDGIRLSNDANMQSRSPSQFGLAGSILGGANGTNSSDVPFQGMDLRDIPVETIEKVEVIQGVASAKYAEITDGAILIERQAGHTPYQFTVNINGSTTNYALSKGIILPHKTGALNLGFNYASSNADPRDKVKRYNRYANSLLWTKAISSGVKNTLTVDYNIRRDNVSLDTDDDSRRMSYSREDRWRFSNRLSVKTTADWAESVGLNLSYTEGKQDNYAQWHLNQLPKGFTDKDTTGTYLGTTIGGRYLAYEQIVGRPVTASADVNLSGHAYLGETRVNLSYGANYSYSNNGGKGIIADSDRPRWVNSNMTNARKYDYELVPALVNYGFYANGNIRTSIFGTVLSSNIGLRYDIQNGYGTLQPRINNTLALDDQWSLSLAYGISTKAPTLAHRYPAPTYLDIPLLDLYANSSKHLYLVHTEKLLNDNSHLKPSRSQQIEVGVIKRGDFFTNSFFGYAKYNKDGYASAPVVRAFYLPDYEEFEVDGRYDYREKGTYTNHVTTSGNRIVNAVTSNSYGINWLVTSRKIQPIGTSFNLSHTLTYSYYYSAIERLKENTTNLDVGGIKAHYFMYAPEESRQIVMMSKLSTITHIPRIGFVVQMNADINWLKIDRRDTDAYYNPIGLYDENINLIYKESLNHPEELPLYSTTGTYNEETKQPIIYGVVNLNITKEIKKNIRIGITAYNAFNLRPQYVFYNEVTQREVITNYNSAPTVTGGINIKF